jgi:sodium-dependent dicarboxylate transporter 2/3/5
LTQTPPAEGSPVERKVFVFLGAVALLVLIYLLPEPPELQRSGQSIPLTAAGKACLAILAFAVTLWVTEAVSFAVTSLLVVLLVPLLQLATYAEAVRAGFGSPIITFFIGVLILSAAFTRSGLGTRMVYLILFRVGTRTDLVLLGFLVSGAFISAWITDMAAAAILLPVGVGLLSDAGMKPRKSNFGRAIMIAAAFGPLIGGIATPAGNGANLVAIAQLDQLAQTEVSFHLWMAYGVPAALLMLPICWRLLLWLFPPEVDRLAISDAEIRSKIKALGPLQPAELRTLLVFTIVITTWLSTPLLAEWTGGVFAPPIEAVALAGGLALFVPGMRVLTWKEAEREINWGGIMLIVAGLSLGLAVFETGAARWLAWLMLGEITLVPALIQPFFIVLAVAALHLMFSSNTVTASIIMPILVALAIDLGADVWSIAVPAAFTSSLAFILVSEGPTTVIPYSAGYFTIKDMAKAGILMTLFAAICVAASVALNVGLGN